MSLALYLQVFHDPTLHLLSISSYILIYLTTCINPIIYVLMSSEYRYCAPLSFFTNSSPSFPGFSRTLFTLKK